VLQPIVRLELEDRSVCTTGQAQHAAPSARALEPHPPVGPDQVAGRLDARVLSTFLIQQTGFQRTEAKTGAVTLMRAIFDTPPAGVLRTSHFAPGKMVIQRFGSAANLNKHA
jgi:hypothetical protein